MKRLRLPPRNRDREIRAALRQEQVVALIEEGFKQAQIAKGLGITQARVSQIKTAVERTRTNKRRMLRLMPSRAEASA